MAMRTMYSDRVQEHPFAMQSTSDGTAAASQAAGGQAHAGPLPLRIVFVDDEPNLLSGLERLLRPQRAQWSMRFCEGAEAALASLEHEPADVVISDMRMPRMTGGEFLAEVQRRWPATMRVILSGQADLAMIHQTIGPAHQFLRKPCDAGQLKGLIERIWRLRRAIANTQVHALVGGMQSLPSLPGLHDELKEALAEQSASIARIGEIIARDPGMSARVLQLLNSAFFGGSHVLADPREAANRLGVDTMRTLMAAANAFSRLETGRQVWFDPGGMWAHSARVARLAGRIAEDLALAPQQVLEAQTAGLLHDAGHMLLAAHKPKEFVILSRKVGQEGDVHGERLVLGCTHGEIGAYLLGLWGLPEGVVESVAWHHEPARIALMQPGVVTCVHIADALDSLQAAGPGGVDRLSREHVHAVGLDERIDAWRDLVERPA